MCGCVSAQFERRRGAGRGARRGAGCSGGTGSGSGSMVGGVVTAGGDDGLIGEVDMQPRCAERLTGRLTVDHRLPVSVHRRSFTDRRRAL